MKKVSMSTLLALALVASHSAAASDISQLRQYAALSTAAGDNDSGEVDHNLDGMNGTIDNDTYDTPVVDVPVAAPPTKVKPVVKSRVVKKTDSGSETPAPKTAKAKAAPAHDIPLIETRNPVESSPDVNYVTGGIGDDERSSIEASKGDYNVHVMSASANGAFVGDARVVISAKNGNEMKELLNVVAGPLLYIKLPVGNYVLDASLGEQKKHQAFTIGKPDATANVHLGWNVDATVSDH